jgi:[ribosomal protein S5]-alanine N-acetyltransferase
MSKYMTFETERLLMRPVATEDKAFILELFNSPKWIEFIGERNVKTPEEASLYIEEKMLPQLEKLGYGNNVVILKDKNIKIGTCGLFDREGLEGVDIGFAFLPQYTGLGYAYESAAKILDAAFNVYNLEFVSAITTAPNYSSRKLLERIGLHFVKMIHMKGDSEELMYFELHKDDHIKSSIKI